MNIVDPKIDEYLNRILPEENPVLREMGEFGRSLGFPIIGPQVGRLLFLLARSVKAMRVLELGSGFGYSGFWFALALPIGGRVVMTEADKENIERAKSYFERAGLTDRGEWHLGNALEIAAELPERFDVILNDIDKEDYPKSLGIAREKLAVGGLFVSDNMLRQGRVVENDRSPEVQGILELTRALVEARDFVTTILPVRDGVSVSLKVE